VLLASLARVHTQAAADVTEREKERKRGRDSNGRCRRGTERMRKKENATRGE
jgi:hypothetical protein